MKVARGETVARRNNRGLAYWSDGRDERILLISPGYQLIALDARTGRPIPGFGKDGIVDLWEGLDRDVVKPGEIGASSPAIVVRGVVVVGAALQAGVAPRSKKNVPGYIRGYDVHTGKRLWTFHTIAAARRVRPRHLGERFVGVHRQHRRVGSVERATKNSATCMSRWKRPPAISTAATGPATTSSAKAWCAWTRAPAAACGISRWCITACGIGIRPPLPPCSISPWTAAASKPSRRSPSRLGSTCSTA